MILISEGDESLEKITYQAASPDESALVIAAKNFGFFFYRRTPTTIRVRESHVEKMGKIQDVGYEILNVLEFNRQSFYCHSKFILLENPSFFIPFSNCQLMLTKVIVSFSTRKCQSVICRYPNGRLVLYCKGADSVIYDKLAGGIDAIKRTTREHLEQFWSCWSTYTMPCLQEPK